MRTLKFRVWSESDRCYRPDLNKLLTYGKSVVYSDEGDRFDIEQFTGLLDRNGKEIYEGDILGGIFEGCYIGWCDTTKSFELFNCYEHYCMACDGDILWCELSDSDIDLEVIGNIHENPELLGGEE